MEKFDVIIIGGGILGIAHAYHSLKAGLKVALIEKDRYPRGATVRNFGQIVPSGMDAKWQAYGRESLKVYKEIQALIDISVRQEGSIYIAHDQEELQLIEELASINREKGYTSELYTKAQCLERYPGLKSSYAIGGLFFPEEINLDPSIAAQRIIDYCVDQLGLNYFPNRTISTIEAINGSIQVLSTSNQLFNAEKVFLCSGTEFQLLFPEVFAQSDIKLVKLQMLETVAQPKQRIPGSILTGWTIRRYESFSECPSYAAIKAKEDAESYQRKWGVHILFKQSPDGSIIIGDSHEYASVLDKDHLHFDMDNTLNCFILSQAQRIFDIEDWQIKRYWNGFYCQCNTQDIFNHTIDDNIHIITGIGGKGMTGSFGYAKENIQQTLSVKL